MMMSGPPPNPSPDNYDITALLSEQQYKTFKDALTFFLIGTGWHRYSVSLLDGNIKTVWVHGDPQMNGLPAILERFGGVDNITEVTGQFGRGDLLIRGADDKTVQ